MKLDGKVKGRMREDALPSKTNQALYVREFVKLAEEKHWNYNIEAFDQPWKRVSEGAVGGYWGLFDKDRADKNVFAGDVSVFPNYKLLALGSILLVSVFSLLLRNSTISSNKTILFTCVNTLLQYYICYKWNNLMLQLDLMEKLFGQHWF